MAEYPVIPLPALQTPVAAANGSDPAMPAGGTSGVVPGLDETFLDRLRNYRPGDIGICELADTLQVTFPVPEWAWFRFNATGIGDLVSAGLDADQIIYTVPMDRRCWLDGVVLERGNGDNLIDKLLLQAPEGYYVDGNQIVLKRITTDGLFLTWPDPNAIQASDYLQPSPILLEPGTRIVIRWAGAGVSPTGMNYEINMRHTKLVRQGAP